MVIRMRNYYRLSCFLHGDYRAPWFDAEGHGHTECPECAEMFKSLDGVDPLAIEDEDA